MALHKHTLRKRKLRGIERARKASKGRVNRGRPPLRRKI